jgi:hypothetical protein
VPTRIVLLSVADPVLVEEGAAEVLDRLNQPDPVLVPLTRSGGNAVHLSRAAVALVEAARRRGDVQLDGLGIDDGLRGRTVCVEANDPGQTPRRGMASAQ